MELRNSACRAERVLHSAHPIELGDEEFRRFAKALDAPAEEMPALRRYARTESTDYGAFGCTQVHTNTIGNF
jgi:uncharacterized protein (DUF1778 family)